MKTKVNRILSFTPIYFLHNRLLFYDFLKVFNFWNIVQIHNHRSIPFFAYYLLPILYTPYGFCRTVYHGITTQSDPNMTPFHLKGGRQSLNKTYLETKHYELDDLRKCYSKFGKMKLNDYMFATVSAAFSKLFTEMGITKQTHFSVSVPVNMKPLPRNIQEVQFNNSCSLCLAKIPISTDLGYTMKKAREYFDSGFNLVTLRFGMYVINFMGSLPDAFWRLAITDNSKNMNTIISNTPGPQEPIYFCDQVIKEIGGVGPNVGGSGITLLISSYWGKIKLQLLADSNLSMDPHRLLAHLEKQLDDAIMMSAK